MDFNGLINVFFFSSFFLLLFFEQANDGKKNYEINIDLDKWSRKHCACLQICKNYRWLITRFSLNSWLFLCSFVVTFFFVSIIALARATHSNELNKYKNAKRQLVWSLERRQQITNTWFVLIGMCHLFCALSFSHSFFESIKRYRIWERHHTQIRLFFLSSSNINN